MQAKELQTIHRTKTKNIPKRQARIVFSFASNGFSLLDPSSPSPPYVSFERHTAIRGMKAFFPEEGIGDTRRNE